MKMNTLLRTTALVLCLLCVLTSCATHGDDTNSTDDISKNIVSEVSTPSENSETDITSEPSAESSEEASEPVEESSEEASEPVEESSEEVSEDDPYYVTEMTDEMVRKFFEPYYTDRYTGDKRSFEVAKDTYYAYGNLNGYTLCYVYNLLCVPGFQETEYTVGGYTFHSSRHSDPSDVSLYLYRDNVFVPFEKAYEQGLFDPKDAYELITNNPSTANPGVGGIRAEKVKSSEETSDLESDYVTEMTDEMADLFLTSAYKEYQIPKLSDGLKVFGSYLLDQYVVKHTYFAFGNLNGYTLFTSYATESCNMAIAKYRAGDYIFKAPCYGNGSFVFLYLYRDNEIIIFEDAYEQGLFDPKDAYELIVNNHPSGEDAERLRVSAEKAED